MATVPQKNNIDALDHVKPAAETYLSGIKPPFEQLPGVEAGVSPRQSPVAKQPVSFGMLHMFGILSVVSAVLAVLIGGTAFTGWLLDIDALKSPLVPGEFMKANTAVGVMLLGTALLLMQTQVIALNRKLVTRIAKICAALAMAIGVITLFEYLLAWDFGFDQLLFQDLQSYPYPGRMTLATAFGLSALGAALLFLDTHIPRAHVLVQVLAGAVLALGFVALLGYLFNVDELYSTFLFEHISISSALSLILVSFGIFCARPSRGVTQLVTGDTPGGFMLRRFIPALLGLTVITGWLLWQAVLFGGLATSMAVVLFLIWVNGLLLALLFRVARSINAADLDRREAESKLAIRAHYQKVVMQLGLFALAARDGLQQVLDNVTQVVALTLGVEYCKVLELTPDGRGLKLVSGVGWDAGMVGSVMLSNTPDSHVGYTLASNQPVTFEDLRRETRFKGSQFLWNSHILSGISVVIYGQNRPYGILGAHSTRPQGFTQEDIHFMQAVANILAETIEREQAEQALRASEEMFSAIFFQADVGIAQVSPGGRWLRLNHKYCQILGYTAEELLELTFQEVTYPPDLGPDKELMHKMMMGQIDHYTLEKRYVRKDGSLIWVKITVSGVWDEHGVLQYFITVAEDIQEQKEAKEALQQLTQELEQRVRERTAQLEAVNKELEAFTYSVSHDLRAPLRSIDGFSKALLVHYGDRLDDQGRVYLQWVRESSQEMAQLIDDLLGLSRVTRTDIHLEPVNLSNMVHEILVGFFRENPDRKVKVEVEDNLIVEGDYRLLKIAMHNLLENAWKFTSKKAQAAIRFGIARQSDEKNPKNVYFIQDNGAGFDMKYVGKLFRAFQRLHTTEDYPGTGIGLVTVQRIIHRLGGEIWAEGEVDKGATFYFTL